MTYNVLDANGLICWVTSNYAYAVRLAEYWTLCSGSKHSVAPDNFTLTKR